MRNLFVQTSNVKRFLAAMSVVEQRGAPEAGFMLVEGDAGTGKSATGQWWAVHNDAVLVRVKAAATPHWLLTDIVRGLGENAPARSCENLFLQAFEHLIRDRRPLVIDEVENAVRDMKVIETIRDLGDLAEVPVILIGREWVKSRLRRERQIWTRISAVAPFGPATEADVALCVKQLCEVPVADAVVAEIHRQSEGHIREVVKAIANTERCGRRAGGTVTLDKLKGHALCQDWQRTGRKAA